MEEPMWSHITNINLLKHKSGFTYKNHNYVKTNLSCDHTYAPQRSKSRRIHSFQPKKKSGIW